MGSCTCISRAIVHVASCWYRPVHPCHPYAVFVWCVCVRIVHCNSFRAFHIVHCATLIGHMLTMCIGCIGCIGCIVQGAQCDFANVVDGQPPARGSINPAFLKQLEHKTLLEHRPGERSFLAEVRMLQAVGAVAAQNPSTSRDYAFSIVYTDPNILAAEHKVQETVLPADIAGCKGLLWHCRCCAAGMPACLEHAKQCSGSSTG